MATLLSPHFTLEEMIKSKTAKEKGIKNMPNAEQTCHLAYMANNYLEVFRREWGSGIIITSGFRGFEYELGSPSSVHPDGWAVDMYPANGKIAEFKKCVRDTLHKNKMPYDQYIDETRSGSEWVHFGVFNKAGKQRCQDLITSDGKNYRLMKRWEKAA